VFARAHAIVAIYFRAVNPAARLQQLVEQIEHADEVGLDAFGVANTIVGSLSIPRRGHFLEPQRHARSAFV
jgi:hypothetical protein